MDASPVATLHNPKYRAWLQAAQPPTSKNLGVERPQAQAAAQGKLISHG
jgi:hypothetical protein